MPTLSVAVDDHETVALMQTGRWMEKMIPVEDGRSYIVVASYYGITGANNNPAISRLNERLLGAALGRAAQFIITPYILCGVFNIDPAKSHACTVVMETGVMVDIVADWKQDGVRQATYRREGVYRGMDGAYTSRIDCVMVNAAAKMLVKAVDYEWEIPAVLDHVGIRVTLSTNRFQ
jgi:hypothetical protein